MYNIFTYIHIQLWIIYYSIWCFIDAPDPPCGIPNTRSLDSQRFLDLSMLGRPYGVLPPDSEASSRGVSSGFTTGSGSSSCRICNKLEALSVRTREFSAATTSNILWPCIEAVVHRNLSSPILPNYLKNPCFKMMDAKTEPVMTVPQQIPLTDIHSVHHGTSGTVG